MKLAGVIALAAGFVLIAAASPQQGARYNAAVANVKAGNLDAAMVELTSLCREGVPEACVAERKVAGALAVRRGAELYNQKNYAAAAASTRQPCAESIPRGCEVLALAESQILRQKKDWRGVVERSRTPCRQTKERAACALYAEAIEAFSRQITEVPAPGGELMAPDTRALCGLTGAPSCRTVYQRAEAFVQAECAGGPVIAHWGGDLCVYIPKDFRESLAGWQPLAPDRRSVASTQPTRSPAISTAPPAATSPTVSASTAGKPAADPTRGPAIPNVSPAGAATPMSGGKRPTADASKCLSIDKNPKIFGAFRNSCSFRVVYTMCVVDPSPKDWSWSFRCIPGEKPKHLGFVGPNDIQADHNRGGKGVHWFACRYTVSSKDPINYDIVSGSVRYHLGEGLKGQCYAEVRKRG